MPKLNCSEKDLEREFSKYLPPLLFRYYTPDIAPTSSEDFTLTALAQLGALRLNASRTFISLFDQSHQYILAEATPTLSLQRDDIYDQGDELWFGTSILHRHAGPCSLLVEERIMASSQGLPCPDPVAVIPDLSEKDSYNNTAFMNKTPAPRFYAGVPLRSPRGAIIGSYCVLDDQPRAALEPSQIRFLEDMATTVMSHLVLSRMREEYRQGERMIRGIGSFVEGKSSLRNWRATTGHDEISHEPSRRRYGGEGQLDERQQALQHRRDSGEYFPDIRRDAHGISTAYQEQNTDCSTTMSSSFAGLALTPTEQRGTSAISSARSLVYNPQFAASAGASSHSASDPHCLPSTPDLQPAQTPTSTPSVSTLPTLSRAANIIRECLEVEGTVFYKSSVKPYVQHSPNDEAPSEDSSTMGNSTDDGAPRLSATDTDASHGSETPGTKCTILAHSMSLSSSINSELPSRTLSEFHTKFLQSLFRRYPRGQIFHFDASGNPSSGSSGEESAATDVNEPCGESRSSPKERERHQPTKKRKKRALARIQDGTRVLKYFPGARSVAFFPLWDSQQERWYAGGFIWTKQPNRSFTFEGHMSFCHAIGSIIMAEFARLDALHSDRAKTDLLGSISHELRSPLHGILGSVELLGESHPNDFQAEMVRSIDTCGRTLLDTIEQMLDYSKINHIAHRKKHTTFRSSLQSQGPETRHWAPLRLDVITEEVVTSLITGRDAYRASSAKLVWDGSPTSLGSSPHSTSSFALGANHDEALSIVLDIDKSIDTAFYTLPGAWRRIVMNLFANSIKFTVAGHIKVSLSARPVVRKQKGSFFKVNFTITDTGKGISAEYLQDQLYKPFSQEDTLSSGTGLGLSVVRQIVDSQNGRIRIKSTEGVGTKVSVSICMERDRSVGAGQEGANRLSKSPTSIVTERVQGMTAYLINSSEAADGSPYLEDDLKMVTSLKKACEDWFGLTFCSESELGHRECNIFFLIDPDPLRSRLALDKIRLLTSKFDTHVKGILFVVFRSEDLKESFEATTQHQLTGSWFIQSIVQPIGIQKLANSISRGLDLTLQRSLSEQSPKASSSSEDDTESAPSSSLSTEDLTTPSSQSSQAFFPSQGLATPLVEGDYFSVPSQAFNERPKCSDDPSPERTASSETVTLASSCDIQARGDEGSTQEPRRVNLDSIHEDAANPATFLLVDDNTINVKILAAHMKRRKASFLVAQNGREAFETYTSSPAACRIILMDISMPVMDGLESTRAIRSFEKQQGLTPSTIVVITGLASARVQQETKESGADAYLAKPVRLKDLDKILKELRGG